MRTTALIENSVPSSRLTSTVWFESRISSRIRGISNLCRKKRSVWIRRSLMVHAFVRDPCSPSDSPEEEGTTVTSPLWRNERASSLHTSWPTPYGTRALANFFARFRMRSSVNVQDENWYHQWHSHTISSEENRASIGQGMEHTQHPCRWPCMPLTLLHRWRLQRRTMKSISRVVFEKWSMPKKGHEKHPAVQAWCWQKSQKRR